MSYCRHAFLPQLGSKLCAGMGGIANHARRRVAAEVQVRISPVGLLAVWVDDAVLAHRVGPQVEHHRSGKTIRMPSGYLRISQATPNGMEGQFGKKGTDVTLLAC